MDGQIHSFKMALGLPLVLQLASWALAKSIK
jgi:hypothetical protein